MGGEFSYDAFVIAYQRGDCEALLRTLESELVRRIGLAASPQDEAMALAFELKALGHDLYNFDQDEDFQLWCGNWVKGAVVPPYELGLELSWGQNRPAQAAAWFRPRS